jgi:predicted metal-dependent peptidase
MTTNDKTLERVLKARAELILARRFYGVLVSNVEPVISHRVPTMGTNGRQHFVNPDFVATLSQEELLGVQAHESEHDARGHSRRRGNRDPEKWNIACDLAINGDLIAEGFKLPASRLFDPKYLGMAAEDIFRSLELDEAAAKKSQEQEPDGDDGDDESASDQSEDGDGDESGKDQADESQSGNESGDADGDGDGEHDDGESSDGTGGGGEPGDETDGEPSGGGEGKTETGEANGGGGEGEGTGEPGDEANGAGEPGEGTSSGDPGGCGEVLDAPPGDDHLDQEWERITRQAASMSRAIGQLPGHVAREIERSDHPPRDWRETLRDWFQNGATTQQTWSRPNRRTISSGLYLPGTERDGINKVCFLIDTSASVTFYAGALEAIKAECQAALDERVIDTATVIYGDTRVTRVDEYHSGDELEFDPRGGGGTMMRPLFDHVKNEIDDASLIVCFTDLEIESEAALGPEPHCPVLWACVGYPARVKQYLANAPWRAAGIEVRPE